MFDCEWYTIFIDIIYISFLPSITFTLAILNIISAKIIMKQEYRTNIIYKYMFFNLLSDSFMLILITLFSPALCQYICPWQEFS
jgi:hypothetical protein